MHSGCEVGNTEAGGTSEQGKYKRDRRSGMQNRYGILDLIAILLLAGLVLVAPSPTNAEDPWMDPFTCDPYTFTFDFPVVESSPYDSIMFPMLVRALSVDLQQITISMWPDYAEETTVADSAWFSFAPSTAPLPPTGVAAFNITCKPPIESLAEVEYKTYIRVARTINGEQYWDRPLGVRVRIGSAVPLVDYSIEGWKKAKIVGDELTEYTQDQIILGVRNKAYTINEFCLYPVNASEPSTDTPDPDSVGDFRDFQALWRQADAITITVAPINGTYNTITKEYNEYELYANDTKFGEFLASSYNRSQDILTPGIYPYRIQPAKVADVPFTLRVMADVPSGIYRLQIHVKPTGISVDGRSGGSIGIEYESKIVLEIERTGVLQGNRSGIGILPWIIIGAAVGALVVIGISKISQRRYRKTADRS